MAWHCALPHWKGLPWLEQLQGLGHLGGGTSSAADVSGDGLVVVGMSHNGLRNEAFRWTSVTGMLGLGTPAGGSGAANSVSADGSIIVGRLNNGTNDEAFRWTAAGGLQGLGVLNQGRSEALGVSADGSVIVGVTGLEAETCGFLIMKPCPSPAGYRARLSLDARHRNGRTGTLPVAGQSGSIARGISADGSVVVGDLFGYSLFCFPKVAEDVSTSNLPRMLFVGLRAPASKILTATPATV